MPANTSIILATINMQRDEKFWGKDALEFDPDRWLDSERTSSGLLASWNIGPRLVSIVIAWRK